MMSEKAVKNNNKRKRKRSAFCVRVDCRNVQSPKAISWGQ
jgi:hypothetical protein